MGSGATIYIPSFIKIGSTSQKLTLCIEWFETLCNKSDVAKSENKEEYLWDAGEVRNVAQLVLPF
jgi:hypothetical protein